VKHTMQAQAKQTELAITVKTAIAAAPGQAGVETFELSTRLYGHRAGVAYQGGLFTAIAADQASCPVSITLDLRD